MHPLLRDLILGSDLLYTVILLENGLSVDELLEVIMSADSFHFGFHYDVIFYDFLHANVRLVARVIDRPDDLHLGPMLLGWPEP